LHGGALPEARLALPPPPLPAPPAPTAASRFRCTRAHTNTRIRSLIHTQACIHSQTHQAIHTQPHGARAHTATHYRSTAPHTDTSAVSTDARAGARGRAPAYARTRARKQAHAPRTRTHSHAGGADLLGAANGRNLGRTLSSSYPRVQQVWDAYFHLFISVTLRVLTGGLRRQWRVLRVPYALWL
jgi:hypothetical protein